MEDLEHEEGRSSYREKLLQTLGDHQMQEKDSTDLQEGFELHHDFEATDSEEDFDPSSAIHAPPGEER
ncbi:putative tyrosine-protein kinase Dnt-like isoform X1 [Sesbania bispinosa]|nr:putative tyrosine-protein kinase Dnt-like isoform X1 [Sesbania bispinosa]